MNWEYHLHGLWMYIVGYYVGKWFGKRSARKGKAVL